MKIISILNNSALVAQDETKQEYVLIGKAISFQKQPKDNVDMSKVEKQFRNDSRIAADLHELVHDIPEVYFDITLAIIRYANKKLKRSLHRKLYISLLDHINNAIERYHNNEHLDFAMENEMRILYESEYQVAEWALEYINMTLDLDLPSDECGFITIHLINASSEEGNLMKTRKVMRISKDVADVVNQHFKELINQNSMDYSRFLTHLKYFSLRCYAKEQHVAEDPICIHFSDDIMQTLTPCLDKVVTCLDEKHQIQIAEHEKKYLSVHLCRLIHL